MNPVPSDIEIARKAKMQPIIDLAEKRLGLNKEDLIPYGHYKAKVSLDVMKRSTKKGKLILVTAMSPTPAGEGKTTTVVGLLDGLNRIGKNAIGCLREPSLGPCFGVKGGAAGGGYAQVVPMEDINLHFTGDFHAIGSAHNLLSAMIDNHVYWGNEKNIDTRKVSWRRVLDMNDRALRDLVVGLGGTPNGFARQTGFDITVASEVMAILCLSNDIEDLQRRLSNITIGSTRKGEALHAKDLKAEGSMTVLLKEAIQPNLVQTLENNPVFIHGGPFANIAHGCNSIIATKTALSLGDYVVTEAGFGADLGAEKFFDIKCRKSNLKPEAVVIVATIRALKMHGGVEKKNLSQENLTALKEGFSNLERHIENVGKFGVPRVVALNHFHTDTPAEIDMVKKMCESKGVKAVLCSHWGEGSKGTEDLAKHVIHMTESEKNNFNYLYPDDASLSDKMRVIAQKLYGAKDISMDSKVEEQLSKWESAGYRHYPICMAKTQSSFSTDPKAIGAPSGHTVNIREVRIATGAEFIVAITGDIMTMPGLPKVPAAENIGLDSDGNTIGLF